MELSYNFKDIKHNANAPESIFLNASCVRTYTHSRVSVGNNDTHTVAFIIAATNANEWGTENIFDLESVPPVDQAIANYFPGDPTQRLPKKSGHEGER